SLHRIRRVIQKLEEFVMNRYNLFNEALDIINPAIRNLILLDAEVAGNQRDASVSRICGNDYKFIFLLLIKLQRKDSCLHQHCAGMFRQRINEPLYEVDTWFVDCFIGKEDLPEGIKIGDFAKYRIMVRLEIVDKNLTKVASV